MVKKVLFALEVIFVVLFFSGILSATVYITINGTYEGGAAAPPSEARP